MVAAGNTAPSRGPRLLWANLHCLLDSSSGASMSVRQMLCSLAAQGYEVQILGATVFDHPHGIGALTQRFDTAKVRPGNCVEVPDGPLVHKLYSTATTSRGQMSTTFGEARESLPNVVVTPNTPDMKPVYGRARLLLAPSLWWESGARVLVEAMLNGIPAITTDHGGSAEMVKDGGILLKLNDCCHQKPYSSVPSCQTLMPLVERLEALFDNPAYYADLAARAKRVGQEQHHLAVSTERLLRALQPLVEQRAGDLDAGASMVKQLRHGVDDRWKATTAQKPS